MKRSSIRRTITGLSLIAAVAGVSVFGGYGRVSANGDFASCGTTPALCEVATDSGGSPGGSAGGSVLRGIVAPVATTMAPEPKPHVDLAITLAGQYGDGSPNIQIWNLGSKDAGLFMVLQVSSVGQRQMAIPGLAAGQSVAYHDMTFPADCGRQVQIIVDPAHTVSDSNLGNNVLYFMAEC